MSNVIEMPLPLRATVKKILSDKFIEFYMLNRQEGYIGDVALYRTNYDLQEFVITSIYLMPHNLEELYHTFYEIRGNKELIEKAEIRFSLQNNEELIEKYMHLLTVWVRNVLAKSASTCIVCLY